MLYQHATAFLQSLNYFCLIMNLNDAVDLIRPHRPFSKSAWTDLGCGSGLFTRALATLLPSGSCIYAVDQNMKGFIASPEVIDVRVIPVEMDFESDDFPFNNLDGILMANSLHFVEDKMKLIRKLESTFHGSGIFIVVEYDTDVANHWVPFPVSYLSLQKFFRLAGYSTITGLGERPSAFNRGNLYAAIVRQK